MHAMVLVWLNIENLSYYRIPLKTVLFIFILMYKRPSFTESRHHVATYILLFFSLVGLHL